MRTVLVLAPNWLGDGVMSLPVVEAIRARCERLIVGARPALSELYAGIADGHVDTSLGPRAIVADIHGHSIDTAILLRNSLLSALLPRLAGCRDIRGYAANGRRVLLTHWAARPADIYAEHQVYYYWWLAKELGVAEGEPMPRLRPSGTARLESPGPWVGMSPGARYGEAKRWPAPSFARLGKLLVARGFRVAIVGGAGEAESCQTIAGEIGPGARSLAGRTTLRELIDAIAGCSVFVTNDSGPLHVASALAVPVVAIFGSTESRSTGPFATRSVILKRDLPCSPCHRRACPIDHRCMTRIHPEEVVEVVARLADGAATPRPAAERPATQPAAAREGGSTRS